VSLTARDPILVLGATGTHGGAVARVLLGAGITVHALVRDPGSDRARALGGLGVRLVPGDLLDRASLVRAFADVAAVYAVTTPFANGADEEERQGETIVAAAVEAALGWLLLASVAAAVKAPVPHFRSKARTEQRLAATSVPWTVIAPSYFYENVLGSRASIMAGRLPLALPRDRPLHQVNLVNLGQLVVAVLARRDEHLDRRVEVAGDAPTPDAMAAALGVRYEPVPLDALRRRSEDLAAMYAFLADEGYAIDVPRLRAAYPEVAWTTFADWAQRISWTSPG
jgi:uncharacterized protein YbjT (DUF2867 family)